MTKAKTLAKVLFAEDDVDISQMYGGALARHGFDVDMVENGAAALEYLNSRPYDILLLDIMMPLVSGIDVLLDIVEKRRRIKIVVLSNLMMNDLPEEVQRVADVYLVKAEVTPGQLASVLAGLVSGE